MKVFSWKPGLDSDFDSMDGTVVNEEPTEKVQSCPCCGGQLLIRENKIVDVLEGER